MLHRQSKVEALKFKEVHQQTNKQFFATASFQNGTARMAKQVHAFLAMAAYGVTGWLVCEHRMKVGSFVTIMMTIWKFDHQVPLCPASSHLTSSHLWEPYWGEDGGWACQAGTG